jgi:hypothetical protein
MTRNRWTVLVDDWGGTIIIACFVLVMLLFVFNGCTCHVIIDSQPTTREAK